MTLYILTSTTIGIIESKIIRDHIKQREAQEKAGLVIIDAEPVRGKNNRKDDDKKIAPKQGWLANLMAKAEEIRREAERRGNK